MPTKSQRSEAAYECQILVTGTKAEIEALQKALKPEEKEFSTPRSGVELAVNGNQLRMGIRSADCTALRASANSVFKLLSVAEKMGGFK